MRSGRPSNPPSRSFPPACRSCDHCGSGIAKRATLVEATLKVRTHNLARKLARAPFDLPKNRITLPKHGALRSASCQATPSRRGRRKRSSARITRHRPHECKTPQRTWREPSFRSRPTIQITRSHSHAPDNRTTLHATVAGPIVGKAIAISRRACPSNSRNPHAPGTIPCRTSLALTSLASMTIAISSPPSFMAQLTCLDHSILLVASSQPRKICDRWLKKRLACMRCFRKRHYQGTRPP